MRMRTCTHMHTASDYVHQHIHIYIYSQCEGGCVYIYIYNVHIHVHTHTRMLVSGLLLKYVWTHIHTCMHACMHACMHTQIHSMYVWMHTHARRMPKDPARRPWASSELCSQAFSTLRMICCLSGQAPARQPGQAGQRMEGGDATLQPLSVIWVSTPCK